SAPSVSLSLCLIHHGRRRKQRLYFVCVLSVSGRAIEGYTPWIPVLFLSHGIGLFRSTCHAASHRPRSDSARNRADD
ncbi:hypothetical protein FB45DRAFT_1001678, partial [Roridomyces roridus]